MTKIDNATPKRLAAPARMDIDLPADEGPDTPPAEDVDLHDLFEAWSRWSRTRRYFAPPPPAGTILGRLSSKTRAFSSGPPDAECNMDLAALHLAILGQPRDALDTQVFWAYYGERTSHIKRSAEALGIGRAHFYRLLKAFCTRVRAVSLDIAQHNRTARQALPNDPQRVISPSEPV
jgi:hypothetical protein